MIPEPFAGVLRRLASAVAHWASERLIRTEQVIQLLREFGYERLEDDFECIYAHSLVTFAADGKPVQLCTLLREDDVVAAFRDYWRTGQFESLAERSHRLVDVLATGDQVRAIGLDVRAELEAFARLFGELTQRARTPGQQELVVLLDEMRAALHGPPLSQELKALVNNLDAHCRSVQVLMTRAHLFDALVSRRLDRFPPQLKTAVEALIADLRLRLDTGALREQGYGMTDSVRAARARAQTRARELSLSEVSLDQLLQAVLEDPGENLAALFERHSLRPDQLASSLGTRSPFLLGGP